VVFQIASTGLIPAKTGAGEADLQARYLNFEDYTFLRQGEERGKYETYLGKTAKGSHLALFPNLNLEDPVWREIISSPIFPSASTVSPLCSLGPLIFASPTPATRPSPITPNRVTRCSG